MDQSAILKIIVWQFRLLITLAIAHVTNSLNRIAL